MTWLNRNSFLLLSVVLIGAVLGYTIWGGYQPLWSLVLLLTIALLSIFWVAARRGELTPGSPEKRIRKGRGAGRPLVVCFYGDFHLGSLLKRPFSARAEREFRGRCDFVYIDMGHPEAARVAAALEGNIGCFLLFDAVGNQVGKVGTLSRSTLSDLLERPGQ